MKKRIASLLLALCLLNGNCLTVFADETESASQESVAEAVTTEIQEQPQSVLEPQNNLETPALTQDSLSIDVDRQYPGMDKTYRAGYSGTVEEGKLRLILSLLNQGGLSTPLNVTLSDSRGKEGSHYLSEHGSWKWTNGRKCILG